MQALVTEEAVKLNSADLEFFPDDGKLYELIDGELFVSRQPSWHHQYACSSLIEFLGVWSRQTGLGFANVAPGLIFADDDDVAPDVIWISRDTLFNALQDDKKLHAAPELVIEVLSPGWTNHMRDKQTKLKLYSRRGVQEYWIADWEQKRIEVYRREQTKLVLQETLFKQDTLNSPLLPGFSCHVADLFF
jgi:Uma2 family endonuclease